MDRSPMSLSVLFLAATFSLLAAVTPAAAQIITVTISSDIIDIDWTSATVSDLPGPDGQVSFSEAMIAANNTPGHQTIGFAIPTSDWTLQWLYPGRAVLRTVVGNFFRAFDEVTIDGTTQTAFTGDTNPDGWEVVIFGASLYLNADNCVLIGFDSTSLSVTGSNGLVQGNTGTMGIEVFGGSGSLIQGNTGGTIKIDRSNDNVVVGNTCQRLRVLGWFGGAQPATGNRIGGPNPEDRNYITGLGTWNSEGHPSGYAVQLFDSFGTIVENNSIGTTPDGLAQGDQAAIMGIWFDGENRDTVVRNNRIAGILGHGIGPHYAGQLFGSAIYLTAAGSGIDIVGNTFGLDANGQPVLGSVTAIEVGTFNFAGITDIQVGGLNPGEGNVIAGHRFNGVTVGRDVPQVRISGNSIYDNGALGVDLVTSAYGYGVTANDPLDGDTGGNGLQNFPVLASANHDGTSLRVIGALHSSPSGVFTIDFFASPDCDGSGFGEGGTYLGSTSVATNASGDADFAVNLAVSVESGWVVTSAATLEPLGATSEFSACVVVTDVVATPPSEQDGQGGTFLRLVQVHPNPFRTETAIRFELPRQDAVRLTIHDAAGRLVRVLLAGDQPAGVHGVVWDGRKDDGRDVVRGVYFYQLRAGGQRSTGRIVLNR